MFGRKKEPKKERKPRPPGSLAQFGIFEIPENLGDLGGGTDDLDDDDGDLEAELAALTAGDNPKPPSRKARPKPLANLDKMIADSMKDINSDEELSGDDDDPDLLNELKEITNDSANEDESPPTETLPTPLRTTSNETMKLLEERLSMYKTAESKAESENQSSKARRFNRGVKTLESLLKNSKLGHDIDTSEIPPVLPPSAFQNVATRQPSSAPTTDISPDTNPPKINDVQDESSNKTDKQVTTPEDKPLQKVDKDILSQLQARQNEYKIAALKWKKAGNLEEALNYIKITKQFDTVIKAVSEGDTVDLSDMPPVPSLPSVSVMPESSSSNNKEESGNQRSTSVPPTITASSVPQPTEKVESLESALKERLEIYRRSKTVAETEGNSSKVRRYGRICKQFEDAIKQHMRGKAIAIDELPTPPGFPPLSAAAGQSKAPSTSIPTSPISEKSEPEPKPSSSNKSEEKSEGSEAPQPKRQAPPIPPQRTNSDKKKKLTSRVDKQIELLEQRQKELKIAALKAKKEGDLDLARDYLRQAKGIDPLIQASQSGLPVDMNSIPLSPQAKLQLEKQKTESLNSLDESFAVITPMECSEASGDDAQIYENLEEQLKKQIKWCLTTRDHCKALGDVASYNKWGRLALDYTKDLDMLRVRKRDNRSPPQHHYEMRTYSIVQSCTDLTDADIEISILRGINFTKETDTYVIFELPWPSESVSTDRTSTVRDTNNPEYNAVFPLTGIIDRKSRQMQRVFKRHALKCQVWAKGCSWNPILCCTHPRGFFRADSLVGTATIKLQPLETQCILHDSFPLMDGRKAVGGKLEVKIRMRNPVLVKQIEQNKDKWLIIDH
ncbi:hypothetical protein TKK_0014210 [Trichogramma kaykai]|uniref:C2 domain-containing protein n=1 Tax=Trichogramma kaykai TaxID=54128 RepID=A0ABD2WER7_9HYME